MPAIAPLKKHYEIIKNNQLYTISAEITLVTIADIIIPANTKDVYIQNSIIKNDDKADRKNVYCILTLQNHASLDRIFQKNSALSMASIGEHDIEDRENRHAYVYLHFDNQLVANFKVIGRSNLFYPTIADFAENLKGIFFVKIPYPKPLQYFFVK